MSEPIYYVFVPHKLAERVLARLDNGVMEGINDAAKEHRAKLRDEFAACLYPAAEAAS